MTDADRMRGADVPCVVRDDGAIVVVSHPSGRADHPAVRAAVERLTARGRTCIVSRAPAALAQDGQVWRAAPTHRGAR